MSVSILIILITAVVSYLASQNKSLMQKLILHPYTVSREKQYYRMISSGFIHGGLWHFVFNMLALFFFGPNVEYIFKQLHGEAGTWLFLVFYLSALVVSDLTTYLKQKDNPGYYSLGASGAVSGIVFAWILFFPTQTIYVYFIPMPGFIMGALYLIYSYYQGKNPNTHINHDAHLLGALYGLIFTVLIYPSVVPRFFQELSRFQIF